MTFFGMIKRALTKGETVTVFVAGKGMQEFAATEAYDGMVLLSDGDIVPSKQIKGIGYPDLG